MKNTFLQMSAVIVFAFATLTTSAQSWSLTGNSGTTPVTNFVGTKDNKVLAFRTNNIERMRISSNGKFGIGTTSPQSKLHVDGGSVVSLSSAGYFQIGNNTSFNTVMDFNVIQSRYNGSPANLFLNNYGGRTYIGNTVADALSDYGAIVYASDYAVYGVATNGAAVYGYDEGDAQGVFGYETGSGDGIHGEAYGLAGYGAFGYSSNSYGIYGYTNNSSSYAGFFSGNVYTTGSYLPSDEKLKQNIKDFTSAMSIINALHPKQYQYRHDGNYKLMNLPEGNRYGLISEDVEKILPGLVKESKFDVGKIMSSKPANPKNPSIKNNKKSEEFIEFKALNYTELIPILIRGMQELNENLQQQMQQQQQRIDKLEKIIENLSANSNTSSSKLSFENSNAYLKQNTPNPFTQNTIIYCNVPSSAKQAQLIIYSEKGSQVKSFVLTPGINNITLNAGTLSAGEYAYSLLIDGKNVDNKKMILTK